MSLLPKTLQFRDDALSAPLPEKENVFRWTFCPIKAEMRKFERDDHNLGGITEADCRQIKGAAQATHTAPAIPAKPVAAPPKFKVGDRVRAVKDGRETGARFLAGDEAVITDAASQDSLCADFGGRLHWWFPADYIELMESSPSEPQADSEGWAKWKPGFAIPDDIVQVRLRNGEVRGPNHSKSVVYKWDFHNPSLAVVAYRVIK